MWETSEGWLVVWPFFVCYTEKATPARHGRLIVWPFCVCGSDVSLPFHSTVSIMHADHTVPRDACQGPPPTAASPSSGGPSLPPMPSRGKR